MSGIAHHSNLTNIRILFHTSVDHDCITFLIKSALHDNEPYLNIEVWKYGICQAKEKKEKITHNSTILYRIPTEQSSRNMATSQLPTTTRVYLPLHQPSAENKRLKQDYCYARLGCLAWMPGLDIWLGMLGLNSASHPLEIQSLHVTTTQRLYMRGSSHNSSQVCQAWCW